MVIGNGMIARRFAAYQDDGRHIIFASGVSNSNNTEVEPFERERQLLEKTILANPEKWLVYFSTCSIYDVAMQSSVYIQHKLAMEELIKRDCTNYCVFRISNPVGFTDNPHTVLNYFFQHIAKQQPFEVWKNASRNLIDLDDMYIVCHHFLSCNNANQQIINIANIENYPVTEIVHCIEKHTGKKAQYLLIEKESIPVIDTSEIEPFFKTCDIQFRQEYLPLLLQKYFHQHQFV